MGFCLKSAAAALAGAAFWLVAGIAPASAADTEVTVRNFAFVPAAVEISAGQTVTWTNSDDTPHLVVADDKSFRSPALDTGDHFSHTFTTPGTYKYFYSLHPHMVGTVIVH